jgi:hypothetical protein
LCLFGTVMPIVMPNVVAVSVFVFSDFGATTKHDKQGKHLIKMTARNRTSKQATPTRQPHWQNKATSKACSPLPARPCPCALTEQVN